MQQTHARLRNANIYIAFAFDLVSEVSKTLKFNVDYSEEAHHDSLIRNPSIQLSLSIQNALGYNGDAHKRTFESKIGWISLQLRNCVVLITMAMNIRVPTQDQSKKVLGLEDSGKFTPSTMIVQSLIYGYRGHTPTCGLSKVVSGSHVLAHRLPSAP